MAELIYLVLILGFAVIDYRIRIIPNLIVIPAAAGAVLLYKHWQPAATMLVCALAFMDTKVLCPSCGKTVELAPKGFSFWRGGDVKLVTLAGALLSWRAFIDVPVSIALVFVYRMITGTKKPLPYAPFLAAVSIVISGTTWITRCLV